MADVKLYGKNGAEQIFEGVETITLDSTVEGETETFSHGIAMENLPLEVDFSNGDMEIDGGGYLVKSAIILKPENLIPENIANGVNIAGVIGTLAASGGGGGGLIGATGTITANSTESRNIITHNLGVVPFFGLIYSNNMNDTTDAHLLYSVGTVGTRVPAGVPVFARAQFASGMASSTGYTEENPGLGTATSMLGAMHTITSTTFAIGEKQYSLQPGGKYSWFVLGIAQT